MTTTAGAALDAHPSTIAWNAIRGLTFATKARVLGNGAGTCSFSFCKRVPGYYAPVRAQDWRTDMAIRDVVKRSGRGLAAAVALVAAVSLTAAPTPAQARVSTGAAVGIGLGAFALGSALGAGAYGYPYGGYAPYGYYAPAPAYYYPPPAYYPAPRSCWDPYYRRYYAC